MTAHFSLKELTCTNTGIKNEPDSNSLKNLKVLAETVLEPLRATYNKPIYVTSGFRCKQVNAKVGGSKTSQHLYGQAADLVCDNNEELFNIAKALIENGTISVGQLINEKNFSWIHISTGTKNQIMSL